MNKFKRITMGILLAAAMIILATAALWGYLTTASFGFSREVDSEEANLRLKVVNTAETYLGCKETDGTHRPIIDLYNSHEPRARGYEVKYEDNWCATFGSAIAIDLGLTDIIPTECGCERQIELFKALERWEEDDNYLPLPGDYIFYAWEDNPLGDCTGWSDHVGIVVGTHGPFIKVIEGNKDDTVSYRLILRNHYEIRGYGLPDYESAS